MQRTAYAAHRGHCTHMTCTACAATWELCSLLLLAQRADTLWIGSSCRTEIWQCTPSLAVCCQRQTGTQSILGLDSI